MNKTKLWLILAFTVLCFSDNLYAQIADSSTYLQTIKIEFKKKWPNNHTENLIYHGHSVPTGYYTRGEVHTLGSYPFLALKLLKDKYPYAVINTILTSIGGEQSEKGAARFADDVLPYKPNILFIDYALNDRSIGLERARIAWVKMIEEALKYDAKIILLTPTPDLKVDILAPDNILEQHARQIRQLAATYHVGLVDSYLVFKKLKESGADLRKYMAQNNHINEAGHRIVAAEIAKWF